MPDPDHPTTVQLDHGILVIDTGFAGKEMAACYLLEHREQFAIVETGTNATTGRVMRVLADRGIRPEQVKYVIPTHVHLDHAGGAGTLMAQLPSATLIAHPRAARHLIDPSRLIAGATAVYGEARFRKMYGEIMPIPEQRVRIAEDGDTLDLNGRQLLFRDTPGHANHHFCIWDVQSRGWFTGDTFGVCYLPMVFAGGRLLTPATTPVQFDPDKLIVSIDLLMSYQPDRMYLTHYGQLDNPGEYVEMLKSQVEAYRQLALKYRDAGESRLAELEQGVRAITLEQARKIDSKVSWDQLRCLNMDTELNAQGLDVWVSRSA